MLKHCMLVVSVFFAVAAAVEIRRDDKVFLDEKIEQIEKSVEI